MTPTLRPQNAADAASDETIDAATDVPEPFPYAAPIEREGALATPGRRTGADSNGDSVEISLDSTACPNCGASTVNGAGLLACPDCEWTGRLTGLRRR